MAQGLAREKAVGAGFDQAAIDSLRLDDAAKTGAFFDQGAGDAGFRQVVGGG